MFLRLELVSGKVSEVSFTCLGFTPFTSSGAIPPVCWLHLSGSLYFVYTVVEFVGATYLQTAELLHLPAFSRLHLSCPQRSIADTSSSSLCLTLMRGDQWPNRAPRVYQDISRFTLRSLCLLFPCALVIHLLYIVTIEWHYKLTPICLL